MAGYIPLSRKFFENLLWKEPREYSKAEAWLDLIQMARFEGSTQMILNSRVIEVRKGDIAASRRYLETRWSWGSTKVSNFLNMLKLNNMITTSQTSGQTIITLCNYDSYNQAQTTEQARHKPATNQRQTSGKPNINKDNKENKDKNNSTNVELEEDGNAIAFALSVQNENSIEISKNKKKEKEKSSAEKEKEPQEKNFEKFQQWIIDNAPQVSRLKEPFTADEFVRLKIDFDLNTIQETIKAMHNRKTLLKDYVSANLTFRSWVNLSKKRQGENVPNKLIPQTENKKQELLKRLK